MDQRILSEAKPFLLLYFLKIYRAGVKGLARVALHEEHVDELDEDAGGLLRVPGCEGQPFIDDHKNQVAKEAEQEEQLRQKHQVEAVLPPEVSERTDQDKRTGNQHQQVSD